MKARKSMTKTMSEATKYNWTMGINSQINNDKYFKGIVGQRCITNTPIHLAGGYVYTETIF